MTFKAGDRVRIVGHSQEDCGDKIGLTGVLIGSPGNFAIVFDHCPAHVSSWRVERHESELHASKKGWYVAERDLEKVRDESISPGGHSLVCV